MSANIDLVNWALNPKNIESGLYLVAIGPNRVPISNQICECGKGWNAPFKFAAYENKVYHRKCLEAKLGKEEFKRLLSAAIIISE